MGVTKVTLKVSEEIDAETDVADTYIPPNGAEVWVTSFVGSAAFTTNSVVMLLWDYGEVGEVILWSTKGSERMDTPIEVVGADNSKKLAVCCSNGESGALVLSGCAGVKVII